MGVIMIQRRRMNQSTMMVKYFVLGFIGALILPQYTQGPWVLGAVIADKKLTRPGTLLSPNSSTSESHVCLKWSTLAGRSPVNSEMALKSTLTAPHCLQWGSAAQVRPTKEAFEVTRLPRAPLPKGYKLYSGTLPVDALGSHKFFMYLEHPRSKKLILWHNGVL
jgi:hypothetical protein